MVVRTPQPLQAVSIQSLRGSSLAEALPRLTWFAMQGSSALSRHPYWMYALKDGFGHVPYALEAIDQKRTVGYLPLMFVRSTLFGRFLVSMPYLNSAGVIASDPSVAQKLIDQAVQLAQDLDTRYLELRHDQPLVHPQLNATLSTKVHMRLELPDFPGPLWEAISSKVRNQVRKGEKSGLTVQWGGSELVDAFYDVFAHNMRDLGTPVYAKRFFQAILRWFTDEAELCVVRLGEKPIAAGLLTHGNGISEILSASSLRQYNATCANMLMYWHLLDRCIQRGQKVFDFGRATVDGPTYKFKKQWGAKPEPAHWQYHLLQGSAKEMRPDNPKYQTMIRMWQKLPVRLTRLIGPPIVRGIP